uniref:Cytochrome c oxidase subunit 2 n=1 Tax=Cyanoplax caverna TaxID=1503210 RepID=A0A0E3DE00_9MOLL|nr:cytochrome c oxidase subunit II [Cyanoplax caverna]AIA77053.1 cytochrome c oxidase subunit II [Cyanoplax caverna]
MRWLPLQTKDYFNFFQDGASSTMEEMIFFHDHAMLILILVLSFISYGTYCLLTNKFIFLVSTESQKTEFIWTIAPVGLLIFLLLPSIQLLYLLDEVDDPALTVKAIGHQWYWTYEYSDFKNFSFDSYMVSTEDLTKGEYRLLEVDNRLVLPINMLVRMVITSADVIHSWTIPAMGVKVDAVPGRLNQTSFMGNFPGVFYGQCSEICGANHSFMPIVLEMTDTKSFLSWIHKN